MYSNLSRSAENKLPARLSIKKPCVLFILVLAACSRGPAPEATPTPSPYPTVESAPIDIPDLGPMLIDPVQLPPRVTSADISRVPHPAFALLPQADYFVSAQYANGSEFGGRVSIFIFAMAEDLDSAWPLVLDTIYTPREISGPGELAAVDHSDLAFIRCNALVHLKLNGADTDEIITFAEKLDADLAPLICR